MNILAIDTSTEACSAALLRADGQIFAEYELAPRQHTRLLPQMMQQVLDASGLDKTDLTHCAFTSGPGAFTGIRIAAAQAQGIGLALGIPLLPVSTLATLAQTAIERYACSRILAALDARMNEIYWAVYHKDDSDAARLVGEENLSVVGSVDFSDDIDLGVGHGWIDGLRQRVEFPLQPELLPDARALLSLARIQADSGLGVSATAIEINYLRNQVAQKSTRA